MSIAGFLNSWIAVLCAVQAVSAQGVYRMGTTDPLQVPFQSTLPTGSTVGLDDLYTEWEGEPRWLTGRDWGGQAFFNSLDYGRFFFPSTVEEADHGSIEIHFSSTDTTWAQTFRRDQGYAAGGVGVFPGAAYDISDPDNPRRLNIGFIEDNNREPINHTWDPDASAVGKYEYLVIMNSDYDGTGETYADVNILTDAQDVLYAWWPRLEPEQTFFASDPAVLRVLTTPIHSFTGVPDSEQVMLSWVYSESDVSEWHLYAGTEEPPVDRIATLEADARFFTHTGLTNHVTYHYRLEAVTASGSVTASSIALSVEPQTVSSQVDLLGFWNQRRRYADVWGYTDPKTGREFALLCERNDGLIIIDITDLPPVEVGFVPAPAPNVDSKDVKVYDHYAILIHERASAQIIDLQDPTNPVTVSTIALPFDEGAHNAFVADHYLYIVGAHDTGGLRIYDLSDPADPTLVGTYEPYYYHDIYVRNDTAFVSAITNGNGIDILDVSDKTQPVFITNFTYPGAGAHNAWTTEDGRYLFVGDETGTAGNHTRVFDISDLQNVEQVADIIVNPDAITHNSYIRDNLLYMAHYIEGLHIFDVSDPTAPVEVGYYDTYLDPTGRFSGAFSVYPYFDSGKIIVSDMQSGLFVLRFTGVLPTSTGETEMYPDFVLHENYPNPFSGATTLSFELPGAARLNLRVYDILGRTMTGVLSSEFRSAGLHTLSLETANWPAGTYMVQLQARFTDAETATRSRLIIVQP